MSKLATGEISIFWLVSVAEQTYFSLTETSLCLGWFGSSCDTNALIQRGGQGVWTPPPTKNHKNIGFLCKTCPDPLKNHKATKPSFNVRPSLARQRNTI